jgi:hypothetical protein
MLPHSPNKIGEEIEVTIAFDSVDRTIEPHPKLIEAFKKNKEAR